MMDCNHTIESCKSIVDDCWREEQEMGLKFEGKGVKVCGRGEEVRRGLKPALIHNRELVSVVPCSHAQEV